MVDITVYLDDVDITSSVRRFNYEIPVNEVGAAEFMIHDTITPALRDAVKVVDVGVGDAVIVDEMESIADGTDMDGQTTSIGEWSKSAAASTSITKVGTGAGYVYVNDANASGIINAYCLLSSAAPGYGETLQSDVYVVTGDQSYYYLLYLTQTASTADSRIAIARFPDGTLYANLAGTWRQVVTVGGATFAVAADTWHTITIENTSVDTFKLWFNGVACYYSGSDTLSTVAAWTAHVRCFRFPTDNGGQQKTRYTKIEASWITEEVPETTLWAGTVRKIDKTGHWWRVIARQPTHFLQHRYFDIENIETALTGRTVNAITTTDTIPVGSPVFIQMKQDETALDDDSGTNESFDASGEPTTSGIDPLTSSGDYQDTFLKDGDVQKLGGNLALLGTYRAAYTLTRTAFAGEVKELYIKLDATIAVAGTGDVNAVVYMWNYTTGDWDLVYQSGWLGSVFSLNVPLSDIKISNPTPYIKSTNDECKVIIGANTNLPSLGWADLYIDYLRVAPTIDNTIYDTVHGRLLAGGVLAYPHVIADITNADDNVISGYWNDHLLGVISAGTGTGDSGTVETKGRAQGTNPKGTSYMNMLNTIAASEGGTWWYDEGLHYIASFYEGVLNEDLALAGLEAVDDWPNWSTVTAGVVATNIVSANYPVMICLPNTDGTDEGATLDVDAVVKQIDFSFLVQTNIANTGDFLDVILTDTSAVKHIYSVKSDLTIDHTLGATTTADLGGITLTTLKIHHARIVNTSTGHEFWIWQSGEPGLELIHSDAALDELDSITFSSKRCNADPGIPSLTYVGIGPIHIIYEKAQDTPAALTLQPDMTESEVAAAPRSVTIWGRRCVDQDGNTYTYTTDGDPDGDEDVYLIDNQLRTQTNVRWKADELATRSLDTLGWVVRPLTPRKFAPGELVNIGGEYDYITHVRCEKETMHDPVFTIHVGNVLNGVQRRMRDRRESSERLAGMERDA